jgi:nucleoside recognition membrane protein YjiH
MRRIGRLWRELRLDGNPLRRACDRTEVVLLACLLSALVIVVPLAAMIAGVQAYGAGRPAGRPLQPVQVTGQAIYVAAIAATATFSALLCVGVLARRALFRRRLAAWEAEWQAVGPRWTSLR